MPEVRRSEPDDQFHRLWECPANQEILAEWRNECRKNEAFWTKERAVESLSRGMRTVKAVVKNTTVSDENLVFFSKCVFKSECGSTFQSSSSIIIISIVMFVVFTMTIIFIIAVIITRRALGRTDSSDKA